MIRSHIKPDAGSVELLLALPLFVLAIAGVGIMGIMLDTSSRAERAAWAYAMSVAHRTDKEEAFAQASDFFRQHEVDGRFALEGDGWDLGHGLEAFDHGIDSELPIAFKGFLLLHPQLRERICVSTGVRTDLFHRWDEIFNPETRMLSTETPTECETSTDPQFFMKTMSIRAPGHDFFNGFNAFEKMFFKSALWAEPMIRAEIGHPFLYALAIPEIISIFRSAFAGPADALIGDTASEFSVEKMMEQFGNFTTEQLQAQVQQKLIDEIYQYGEERLRSIAEELQERLTREFEERLLRPLETLVQTQQDRIDAHINNHFPEVHNEYFLSN